MTVEIIDKVTGGTLIYKTVGYEGFPYYQEIKTTSATYYITFFGGEWTVFD
ncbi:MAG: hypothetical protein LUE93_01390 [Bacteroides sp.]|nr:hypothetical protein [Bacteroides sp.]